MISLSMFMLHRTVTRLRARREAAPVVKPAASASETTPKASDPEVVILTTEVAVEEHAAARDPTAAREETPLVPGGDSTEDFARHVSVELFCHFLASLSGAQQRSRWK